MGNRPSSRLVSWALIAVIVGLFIVVIETRNRQPIYASIEPFVGCYSDGANRLLLEANGRLAINGTAAGSSRIVKPVGGKHGYLVEVSGLTLASGRGGLVIATGGTGGFLWPINDRAINLTFAPNAAIALKRTASSSC